MSLAPGTRIGPYEVVGPLGAGGMGEIYRAFDPRLDREVALKILPPSLAEDEKNLRRFEREAKSLAALNHPNIVVIHSVEAVEGTHFLTMELVEGTTLEHLIPDDGMPLESFLEVAVPLSEAIAVAHDNGIVHRDLKPANVMIASNGRVKVLDFGLAKRAAPAPGSPHHLTEKLVTMQGMIVGTAPYMSPEQIEGGVIDHRSDVFSLGILFYEMLTGRRPFQAESLVGLASSILTEEPPPVRELRVDLPQGMDRVLRRCLSKNREDRYGSLHELIDDLHDVSQDAGSDASDERPRVAVSPTVVAAAILIPLLLLSVWFFRGRAPQRSTTGQSSLVSSAIQLDSLAVLPLENLSGDPEQDFFAEGMTEAIITDLAKLKGLKVISRTSVTRYRNSDKLLPEIAEELGVEAIVHGSVMRSGDHVRISAQLIDASSDEHLWAESYQDRLRDVLSLQSRIAREIARQVAVTLSPEDVARLSSTREVDPEAYESYLRGRSIWSSPGGLANAESINHFREAIRLDPDYALAHAGLADVYLTLAHFVRPPHEAMPLAKQEALKALQLDPSLAQPHAAYADVVFHYDWDWDLSEREFLRAIELNPGYAVAHWWYAGLLAALGRHEEAAREIAIAQDLDPMMPSAAVRGFALRVHYWARRPDRMFEAVERFAKHDEEVDLGSQALATWLSVALEGRDLPPEKLVKLREQMGQTPDAAVGLAAAGDRERARSGLLELERTYEEQYISPYMIAIGWAFLGEDERALEWIDKAVDDRAADLIWINVEPAFDSIRDDPRFRAVIEEMGFPPQRVS